ncbi:hypothetical protein ACRE_077690 [Hapsidospora chrysogenum ATCC 11550]|uniref:Aminoglycoside phosphotransferase domain-containing protein n=1 Tax=Hapsidospora chrysogenum (strain ATCC 11550 / CBS 779.69 / DSM 880 / IAM 14645 / JCM 23072 / IMI 49137) TaxID=857340 RepID=A0A086SWM9_HAPC1|nr:hypothetical protein ACRE_077690 [Hapsidospora chrysogenum ATCC 11550]
MEDLLKYTPSRAAVLTVSPVVNQKFFERNPGLSEQICLKQAAQILKCPATSILPAAIQGASSFTIAKYDARPGELGIVQFRDLSSQLSRDTITLARRTYGNVVPNCDAVTCGLSDKAHVYLMTLAGGIAFSAAQRDLYQDQGAERLMVTVANFASFVASSLSTKRQNTDDTDLTQAYEKLAAWEAALPARFQSKLAEVRVRLPVIFGREFPQVLNHADLVEMNIQVDDASGAITGVIDWENANYGAFGVALASLEVSLGICTGEGVWIWHPQQNHLRTIFYNTLCAEIDRHLQAQHLGADDVEAARMFGLFVMYGSWATAARADGHDGGGDVLVSACLEAGLGEGTAAQPFLRQHWGVDRGGHG